MAEEDGRCRQQPCWVATSVGGASGMRSGGLQDQHGGELSRQLSPAEKSSSGRACRHKIADSQGSVVRKAEIDAID